MSLGPGLVIAAPASGAGKTMLTLALLRACRRAGLTVRSAKVGPDYIDPAFHAAASGGACINLDPWAMRPALLDSLCAQIAADAELFLVEGVMGLFDGARDGSGSTADLAAMLGLPVVLVVDVRGQGASVAAVVQGFRDHRADVRVAGVIANRVGGDAHVRMIAEALRPTGLPLLGALPRLQALDLPERHLGLVQAAEHAALESVLEAAGRAAAAAVDLAALRSLAIAPETVAAPPPQPLPPPGQRIAVAQDAAFAFCYPHLLDGWRNLGAAILPFSPLSDEAPDTTADAVYLPGGYPELHAGRLASNARFKAGMRDAAARGASVYGECGGYMLLGHGLVDADGTRHDMLGLLPLECSFAERRLHLGYRRIEATGASPFPSARQLRGHEFHYCTVLHEQGEPLFRAADAAGADLGAAGLRSGTVCGSFLHVVDVAG
jgi:cobyrinic acid a,c-diamide synthase